MTGLGKERNPYWSIFEFATGHARAGDFIIWVHRKWREFDVSEGRKEDYYPRYRMHDRFRAWLCKQFDVTLSEDGWIASGEPPVWPEAEIKRPAPQEFRFMSRPWENSLAPTIVRECPNGGDPHILATLARIHNPDALYELCRLANSAVETGMAAP